MHQRYHYQEEDETNSTLQHRGEDTRDSVVCCISRRSHHREPQLKHITTTSCKADNILNFLRRNLWHWQQTVVEKAYLTLSRPFQEYASSAWDPLYRTDNDRLEMCHRRAARFVLNDFLRNSRVTIMLNSLAWKTLEERRKTNRLVHLSKAVNNFIGLTILTT